MSLKNPNPVSRANPKRIAIVLASPALSSTTGWPVGFWWSELTHTYYEFTEKGFEVTLFSPNGGACEPDAMSDPNDPSGYSDTDLITQGFLHMPNLRGLIDNTRAVSGLSVADFDAMVVAGGQAHVHVRAGHEASGEIRRVLRIG